MAAVQPPQKERVSIERTKVVATVASLPILAAVFFALGWVVKPAPTTDRGSSTTAPKPTTTEASTSTSANSTVTTSREETSTTNPGGDTTPEQGELAKKFPLCEAPDSLGCLFEQLRRANSGETITLAGAFNDVKFTGTEAQIDVYLNGCGPTTPNAGDGLDGHVYSAAAKATRDQAQPGSNRKIDVEGQCSPSGDKSAKHIILNIGGDVSACQKLPESSDGTTLVTPKSFNFFWDAGSAPPQLRRCPTKAGGGPSVDSSTTTTTAQTNGTTAGVTDDASG